MGKNSVQKVSSGWKKRVKIEYARLRHQKKFRHQDDIRVAWRGNRVAMQASHIKVHILSESTVVFVITPNRRTFFFLETENLKICD